MGMPRHEPGAANAMYWPTTEQGYEQSVLSVIKQQEACKYDT